MENSKENLHFMSGIIGLIVSGIGVIIFSKNWTIILRQSLMQMYLLAF